MIAVALRACGRDQRGVVMIEFVIAFVPVFVLFLGIVQLALLSAAQLVVQHAAVCGARSASVVLDDDPRFHGLAARGELQRAGDEDGPRMGAIRRAVHAPLAAIAPDPRIVRRLLDGTQVHDSVARAVGSHASGRFVLQAARYLPVATSVVFPLEPGGDEVAGRVFELADRVTVRVAYLLPCTVPIASRLACKALAWDPVARRLLAGKGASASVRRALAELRSAPRALYQDAFAQSGLPVAVLQAEATMPLQRAAYCYASEGERCRRGER